MAQDAPRGAAGVKSWLGAAPLRVVLYRRCLAARPSRTRPASQPGVDQSDWAALEQMYRRAHARAPSPARRRPRTAGLQHALYKQIGPGSTGIGLGSPAGDPAYQGVHPNPKDEQGRSSCASYPHTGCEPGRAVNISRWSGSCARLPELSRISRQALRIRSLVWRRANAIALWVVASAMCLLVTSHPAAQASGSRNPRAAHRGHRVRPASTKAFRASCCTT
jgi:hypothetical protein